MRLPIQYGTFAKWQTAWTSFIKVGQRWWIWKRALVLSHCTDKRNNSVLLFFRRSTSRGIRRQNSNVGAEIFGNTSLSPQSGPWHGILNVLHLSPTPAKYFTLFARLWRTVLIRENFYTCRDLHEHALHPPTVSTLNLCTTRHSNVCKLWRSREAMTGRW